MADDILVTGVAATEGEDQAADSFYDFETGTAKVSDLVKKVEVLEREKVELVKENKEVKEKWKKLEEEVLGLMSEKERMEDLVKKAEEDGKALGAIAGRAADLETEVSRLQHDLVSAVHVEKAFEESKSKAAELEKEKERFLGEIEELKKAKADVEAMVSELESKVKGAGEDAKAELVVKEKQLKMLEDSFSNDRKELVKEKEEKNVLKEALEASEAKVSELETKLIQLQKKAEEGEKIISELKENTAEAVNGVIDRDAVLVNDGSKKGTTDLQWAVGAGVSAAVVIGGALCLLYAKKR